MPYRKPFAHHKRNAVFVAQTNVYQKRRRGFAQELSISLSDAQVCVQKAMDARNQVREK